MNIYDESKHPRGGNPTNTGEYSAKANSAPESALPNKLAGYASVEKAQEDLVTTIEKYHELDKVITHQSARLAALAVRHKFPAAGYIELQESDQQHAWDGLSITDGFGEALVSEEGLYVEDALDDAVSAITNLPAHTPMIRNGDDFIPDPAFAYLEYYGETPRLNLTTALELTQEHSA